MIRTATGPILAFLRCFGYKGITSLWGVIYLYPGYESNAQLIRHEQTHLEQMAQDGKLLFVLKYVYWSARYGYRQNPYEIEARKASGECV